MRLDLVGLLAVGMDSINRDIHRFWGEGFLKFLFNIFFKNFVFSRLQRRETFT